MYYTHIAVVVAASSSHSVAVSPVDTSQPLLNHDTEFLPLRIALLRAVLSTRPAVTPATLKRAATSFAAWWTEARWVWTVCLRLLPDSVATAIWTPGKNPVGAPVGRLYYTVWSKSKPFCAWAQHANHSATEPPTRMWYWSTIIASQHPP